MIRIIDMREATDGIEGFAIWDTVTNRFRSDRYGAQAWENESAFREACDRPEVPDAFANQFVERVVGLLPEDFRS